MGGLLDTASFMWVCFGIAAYCLSGITALGIVSLICGSVILLYIIIDSFRG
jgi:hypothetical protein